MFTAQGFGEKVAYISTHVHCKKHNQLITERRGGGGEGMGGEREREGGKRKRERVKISDKENYDL